MMVFADDLTDFASHKFHMDHLMISLVIEYHCLITMKNKNDITHSCSGFSEPVGALLFVGLFVFEKEHLMWKRCWCFASCCDGNFLLALYSGHWFSYFVI